MSFIDLFRENLCRLGHILSTTQPNFKKIIKPEQKSIISQDSAKTLTKNLAKERDFLKKLNQQSKNKNLQVGLNIYEITDQFGQPDAVERRQLKTKKSRNLQIHKKRPWLLTQVHLREWKSRCMGR